MRILVVGAGIAGLTFAWWARRQGHVPVVAERAPALRDAGYMIDFYGVGVNVAERMGIVPDLQRLHYPIPRLRFVDGGGADRYSIPYPVIRRRLFGDRHYNFMRGELERLLYQRIADDVEVRFAAEVVTASDRGDGVEVRFGDGSAEAFDLVVGADGVHSALRHELDSRPPRFLGYRAAAFLVPEDAVPPVERDAFSTLTVPGRQVSVYPIGGGRAATFFLRRERNRLGDRSPAALQRELNEHYADLGWIVPGLIAAAARDPEPYFDEVLQVETPAWSRGRRILLGDAAWCVSVLGGAGATLAMLGASVLAEELPPDGAYERRLRGITSRKQAVGRSMGRWLVPPTAFQLALRDLLFRVSVWPVVSRIVRSRTFT